MTETNRSSDTATNPPSLTRPVLDGDRRHGFRAVGLAVSKLAAPIVSKRGGGVLIRLKAEWAAIVGDEWAALTWPSTLGRDGALKLRANPVRALELQHRAPLMVERINLFFGRPLVTRLVLVQGPLPLDSPRAHSVPMSLASGEAPLVDEELAKVANPQLRAALARLGRRVAAAGR